MKTITIFLSTDLEPEVVRVLEEAGIDGYLRVGEATGTRVLAASQVPRIITWDALMLVVPTATDPQLVTIRDALAGLATGCGVKPCLHVVAAPVESLV